MRRRWMIRMAAGLVMFLPVLGCNSSGGGQASLDSSGPPTGAGEGVPTATRPVTPTDSPQITPTARQAQPTHTPTAAPPETLSCEALREAAHGARADFAPSIPNPMNCVGGYGSSNYAVVDTQLPAGAAEELHVIGVYEGRGAEHGPTSDAHVAGVVEIEVRPRPKPVVLALSAYEPVRWHITIEPGAVLSRVIVQGYYTQEVEGLLDGVAVLHADACDCVYGWEVSQNQGGCSYAVVIASVRALTGLHESSFQGCYAGDRFEVPYWDGAPPVDRPTPIAGDETIAPRDVPLPGCEAVTQESEYCVTFTGGAIAVLGLDSGTLCPLTPTTAVLADGYTTSIAWRGEILYTCSEDGLVRLSLRDGSWEAAQVACEAVADFDGGLLLMPSLADYDDDELRAYRDYPAVLAQDVQRTYALDLLMSRMTVHGRRLFGAWHATDVIEVADLDSGQPVGVLGLQDYDTWIWGMAVTDAGHLVLTDGYDRVVLFDVETGAQLHSMALSEPIFGLACTSRQTPPAGTPTPAPTAAPLTPSASPAPRPPQLPSCDELAAAVHHPGQQANFPPSTPIAMNCSGGYQPSNYTNSAALVPADAPAELHVVSVYEGVANPGFRSEREGAVTVNVRARPKPVVLLLASTGPTVWRITLADGAALARVITQGPGAQSVEGVPAGVAVEQRVPDTICGFADGWEIWNDGDYLLFIADVRAYTGLIETSFQGCYTGAAFDVPYWNDAPPTTGPTPVVLDESIARESMVFPGCEAVTAERQYCLTTTFGGPALVGLDSGAVCPVVAVLGGSAPDVSSIAWRGEAMYACAYDAGLVRVSLRDGGVELAQVPCAAVTDYRGNLLLASSPSGGFSPLLDSLYEYATYADVLAGRYGAMYDGMGDASRMTVHGDTLYRAWHSTDTVDVSDLRTGQARPSITLEGYDGWILGMAVTDDGELVISGDTWGDTIRVFDAATGAALRSLRPQTPVWGLSCVTRR